MLYYSYIHMTDLVDQMFPPIHRRWAPEYTDFNFWRAPLPEIELPELSPPSPALSARSDTSGGSRLGRLVSLGRVGSRASSQDAARQAVKDTRGGQVDTERRRTTSHPGTIFKPSSVGARPSSPLAGPVTAAEDLDAISDAEGRMQGGWDVEREHRRRMSFDSMPGSFEERRWMHDGLDEEDSDELASQDAVGDEDGDGEEGDDEHDDEYEEPQFDTFATDEMEDTPFL